MAMVPCWAKRATAGRCIVNVSVLEVVQSSGTLCLAFFFSGWEAGGHVSVWRQVEVARSRKSGGPFNQKLVPSSSGLGDFHLRYLSELYLINLVGSNVVSRHTSRLVCASLTHPRA